MITSKGYKILLEHEKVNEIKKELMIMPYSENATRFPIFRISEKYLYMPKYYGIKKLGIPSIIKEQEGIKVSFNFKGKLRDYQIDTCNKILDHLHKNECGLANIYTGWGKTCASLWLVSKLQLKTLIIVHTENLLQQWKERINEFLGISINDIGIIQGPKIIIDKNICIGMIQSISMKEYPSNIFKDFGFTIYDECHHTPGRIFSKIFYKIGTKYNLGLSATLIRNDGLTKVIKYFIGETIISLKLCTIIPNIIIKYSNIEPLEEKKMINGKVNLPFMINQITDSFARNLEIINIIKDKYLEQRKILVLSDRRNHCIELKRLLGDEYDCGLYLGGMKNNILQESNKKKIIFATYQIASEGYDNKELDTLVFATPKTKIEQAVGRILRQINNNIPEVIDIVDPWSVFNNSFFTRMKFYKKQKFNINHLKFDDDDTNLKLKNYAFTD